MPAPAPRVWEVRTTTANESSTMQGCEDPRPQTEKGLEMRLAMFLCVGILLMGAIGCLEPRSPDVASTDPVAEDSAEGQRVPGEEFLRGLFTYMADAALFEDCATGRRYPVAMEAGYLELERAYLEQRSEPGAPLLVIIRAGVEKRPPMEGDGEIDTIVVEGFEAAFPGEHCNGE